jgi:hypothetical protein
MNHKFLSQFHGMIYTIKYEIHYDLLFVTVSVQESVKYILIAEFRIFLYYKPRRTFYRIKDYFFEYS